VSAVPKYAVPAGLPAAVQVVEVGARDGLQNEPGFVPTEAKLELLGRLAAAGLRRIEATAFVSPKWVPQMADHAAVMRGLPERPGVRWSALVPNMKGYEAAVAAGAREVIVFTAASESFSRHNTNCSIAGSLARFEPVVADAHARGIAVRGYVSCVLGCPYEGEIAPAVVATVSRQLLDLGCYEVSLGDTIGIGTPGATLRLLEAVAKVVPVGQLAGHFHDTWAQGLANVYAALQFGVATFDSSVSGIGGCPYARGASGNLATEDLVYMLHGLGYDTGIDIEKVSAAGADMCRRLGRPPESRVARALAARRSAVTVVPP
jgi:hydroxymethylglutaryl-CoA lyase